jgi:hypothetical protein
MIRKTLAACALSTVALTSCLGSNNLHDSIQNWNAEFSDQDWLNEAIFIGFMIVPVYPFAYLGDSVIFNTIEYWTGENPINDPGEFPGFTSKD